MTKVTIPVIDLFAGPGGLGEGFSSFIANDIKFKVALSIEKDRDAHSTLLLRSFFRQFESNPPDEYYSYLSGRITREELFEKYPRETEQARFESWLHELNDGDIPTVRRRTKLALSHYDSKHWVLIGGPPCQAYSIVGRARMKNHTKNFDHDERHFLYRHYLRLVASLKPSIFIMENVKGILTASVDGESIFGKILDDLECPGVAVKELDGRVRAPSRVEYDIYSLVCHQETYEDERGIHVRKLKPQDYIIHAEKYGVPQRRHRVILLGIRKDIDPSVAARLEQSSSRSVSEVLEDLPPLRGGITKEKDSGEAWKNALVELLQSPSSQQIDRRTLKVIHDVVASLQDQLDRGGLRVFPYQSALGSELASWYSDDRLACVLNHQSKSHMKTDLWRYLYATCYNVAHGRSPLLTDYPDFLLPNHQNAERDGTKFLDRFKVQVGDSPASTVTSHIAKDGHFFIHHDPGQCRAWTVREAARIQTFPDNYFFEGNRSAQYKQVGNAVPPFLACQIASVVAEHLKHME